MLSNMRRLAAGSALVKRTAAAAAARLLSSFDKTSQGEFSFSHDIVFPAAVSPGFKAVPDGIRVPSYVSSGLVPLKRGPVVKSSEQIQGIRRACRLARKILRLVESHVKVGVTTEELDGVVHQASVEAGAYPSPLRYKGFPKSCCTSVNNVACHGVPDDRPLADGDVVNVDITVYLDGYHGDTSETFEVGQVDEAGRRLIASTVTCRDAAIGCCRPGQRFAEIGAVVSRLAGELGFSVVPVFCGHGIGEEFHEIPDIFHVENHETLRMEPGMIFTIEPVLSEGGGDVVILEDGWTAVTVDCSRTAQCEHTVLVTDTGTEILTL